MAEPVDRTGEYALRGDYHRELSRDWEFYPTYIAKLEAVRTWLDSAPPQTTVLDAGCGEGVLVDEYRSRLAIEGLDPNYSSDRVRTGSLTSLPYPDATFDRALCLDVLEHLTFDEQPRALAELHRVLRPGGLLLVSVPNLAGPHRAVEREQWVDAAHVPCVVEIRGALERDAERRRYRLVHRALHVDPAEVRDVGEGRAVPLDGARRGRDEVGERHVVEPVLHRGRVRHVEEVPASLHALVRRGLDAAARSQGTETPLDLTTSPL